MIEKPILISSEPVVAQVKLGTPTTFTKGGGFAFYLHTPEGEKFVGYGCGGSRAIMYVESEEELRELSKHRLIAYPVFTS